VGYSCGKQRSKQLYCVHLASAGQECMASKPKTKWRKGRESALAQYLAAGGLMSFVDYENSCGKTVLILTTYWPLSLGVFGVVVTTIAASVRENVCNNSKT